MILTNTIQKSKQYLGEGVILILLVLVIILGAKSCNSANKVQHLQDQLVDKEFVDSMLFTTKVLKNGVELSQNQLPASKEDATVKSIEKSTGTKNLQSQVKIVTKYILVHDTIAYEHENLVFRDSTIFLKDSSEALLLPARITKIDSSIQMDEEITSEGVIIDYLKIPNTTTITIADREKDIFKTTPVVIVDFSNKNIEATSMKNIVIKSEKSKKMWKAFGIGTGVGAGVATILIGTLLHFVK